MALEERAWLLSPPRPREDSVGHVGWWRLVSSGAGGDAIRQNMPMAVLVLLTQEPHASSCQMIKILCFLPSLGASHSGRDYMDAKASRLLGM